MQPLQAADPLRLGQHAHDAAHGHMPYRLLYCLQGGRA